MNKNKKVNKDTKFKIALKRIINIFCYVCTGITLLFLIIYGCFGCSKNNVQTKANIKINHFENQFVKRNEAYNFYDINNSLGFGLRSGDFLKKPSQIVINYDYITDYYVSLGSTMSAVVRDSNDSVHMLDEQWHIYYNLHFPIRNNDYIRFETPNWTRVYSASIYDDTFYVSYSYSAEDYYYDEIFLPSNLTYEAQNYSKFKNDMISYFELLTYYDYQLQDNWSPLSYVPSTSGGVSFNLLYENAGMVDYMSDNSVYGRSYSILSDTLFSVNGFLYTDLLAHTQVLNSPSYHIYYENYTNFNLVAPRDTQYFVDFVYAYNRITDRNVVIWNQPYDDDNNTYSIYTFEKGFVSNSSSKIRLFDRHLSKIGTLNYSNGNVLTVNGYISYENTGDASIQNALDGVFSLMGNAFNGINTMLNISIGSYSLWAFLLIPFTCFVLVTIIHLFKR